MTKSSDAVIRICALALMDYMARFIPIKVCNKL
jgi:hypothetical protein